MVIAGDFKVELVDAQTKEAFPEHTTNDDGKTYVVVKPGIEYYISYERMTANNTSITTSHQQEDIIVTCSVDGKDLGWAADYFVDEIDYQPNYGGSWDCKYDGSSYQEIRKKNALHIRPQPTTTSPTTTSSPKASMMISGKVEFQIWKMGSEIIEPSHSYQSDFATKTTTSSMNGDDDVTLLSSSNSTLGSTYEIENVYVEENCLFEEGRLLETITLNYCTKDWLINANKPPPPPPPDNNDQATMKSVLIQLQKRQQQKCNRGKRPNTGGITYELFDLASSMVSMDYCDDFTSKKDNSAATSIRRLTNAALSIGSNITSS